MSITITTNLDIGPFGYLVEDIHLKGGYRVVADNVERDKILETLTGLPPELTPPPARAKAGMLVFTQDSGKMWQLASDKTTWTEFKSGGDLPIATDTVLGGIKIGPGLSIDAATGIVTATPSAQTRQTFTFTTPSVNPGSSTSFVAHLGKTVTLLEVGIDQGYAEVTAFATNAQNESNPYTFVAVPAHLKDDGSTTLQDGTTTYGRRYTIISNLDSPVTDASYWNIKNTGTVAQPYTVTIIYVKME